MEASVKAMETGASSSASPVLGFPLPLAEVAPAVKVFVVIAWLLWIATWHLCRTKRSASLRSNANSDEEEEHLRSLWNSFACLPEGGMPWWKSRAVLLSRGAFLWLLLSVWSRAGQLEERFLPFPYFTYFTIWNFILVTIYCATAFSLSAYTILTPILSLKGLGLDGTAEKTPTLLRESVVGLPTALNATVIASDPLRRAAAYDATPSTTTDTSENVDVANFSQDLGAETPTGCMRTSVEPLDVVADCDLSVAPQLINSPLQRRFIKALWIMYQQQLTVNLIVTCGFWAVTYPAIRGKVPSAHIRGKDSLVQHLFNSIFLILEFLLTSAPVIWRYSDAVTLMSTLYLTFGIGVYGAIPSIPLSLTRNAMAGVFAILLLMHFGTHALFCSLSSKSRSSFKIPGDRQIQMESEALAKALKVE